MSGLFRPRAEVPDDRLLAIRRPLSEFPLYLPAIEDQTQRWWNRYNTTGNNRHRAAAEKVLLALRMRSGDAALSDRPAYDQKHALGALGLARFMEVFLDHPGSIEDELALRTGPGYVEMSTPLLLPPALGPDEVHMLTGTASQDDSVRPIIGITGSLQYDASATPAHPIVDFWRMSLGERDEQWYELLGDVFVSTEVVPHKQPQGPDARSQQRVTVTPYAASIAVASELS